MECEAREDYYRTQRGIQCMLEEREATIETLSAEIETQNAEIKTQAAEIAKLHAWMREHGYDPADVE